MLKNLLILSLCFVAINAGGEFSVLTSPKSISFKGSDVLNSQYVGDVINAALGNAVQGDTNWSGLTINNPFNLAKGVIAVLVDGAEHITVNSNAKTFKLEGSASDESISALSTTLEASNVPVCDIDFNQFDKAVLTFRSCFGDIQIPDVKTTKNLNNDKQFLQSIAYVQAAADNLANMVKPSNVLVMRLSLGSVAKEHGQKSDALNEAVKLVSNVVSNLNAAAQKSSNNEALVVAIANHSEGRRTKRFTPAADDYQNTFNLATYYDQTYPVIFNIILWFMVVFGLSLLAICYAIGSMDPGRDSIIYRMTSTRMKKDN